MKIKSVLALLLVLVTSLCTLVTYAQEEDANVLAVVEYMKVKPENVTTYLKVEQEIWKPMHQERANRGNILEWYLYAVNFTGTNDEYNYITVNIYENLEKYENNWPQDIPEKVHPGMDFNKSMEETLKSRDLVRSEFWYQIANAAPENPPEKPIQYFEFNFMQVEPENISNYVQAEIEIWKPIHQELIKAGSRAGWSFWSLIYPGGFGGSYQYATINIYPEFSKIGAANFIDAFNKAHPGKNMDEDKTGEYRKIVRTELWELIDFVEKQQD